MLGASVAKRLSRRGRSALAVALVLAAVFVPRGASAESPADGSSFGTRFAAVEEPQPPTAAAAAPPAAEPPKDALHGAPVSAAPASGGADARSYYRGLIEKEAAVNGLAPEIAEAVMAVESGYNPAAVGTSGEIGLMQIMPSTARMLGFAGTLADLAVPETNIHYGVAYLAQAWRLAGGDLCTAVMKYRAGHGETRFSFLSVNYCIAVRGKLMARGFPVTGRVPIATFGDPAGGGGGGGGGCRRKCTSIARVGHVNLAALNSQLSALVVQVRAGR